MGTSCSTRADEFRFIHTLLDDVWEECGDDALLALVASQIARAWNSTPSGNKTLPAVVVLDGVRVAYAICGDGGVR
jgi:hypothetical protein